MVSFEESGSSANLAAITGFKQDMSAHELSAFGAVQA